ncbi:MAG: LysR family transcriptional regulator [Xanthobacteraceae bacterium]
MHQVRYFLAAVIELNFTKAAERCNVAQPSLTRAIKQLEEELGGELFRRERPQAQLTELGLRMYPLLKQCYESALSARSLASAIQSGQVATLKLALSSTVSLELLTKQLSEVDQLFTRLEIKLLRGTATQIIELLKSGAAELAITGDLGDAWDRLDRWPLFSEEFGVIFHGAHPLTSRSAVDLAELKQERWLHRAYCEQAEEAATLIRSHGIDVDRADELTSDSDLLTLVRAGFGVAFAPRSVASAQVLKHTTVNGIELRRTVYLYAVAGRQRSAPASALLKMVRAADWSGYGR